ncbi:hypothetical protein BAUCODRAFT_148564 [Baudoinia panamericana UAMH 10762]|uniref:Uncharacterized protein n=1 Tax=Baudoinia panamericana (strain UAMH 10762) TaxID=717646 RepID=M2N9A2_BAUPA|nr:uncharacterized protein BAUCODRAFT_148564 [Baudoinia panamericana UAMH 10762]EMC95679.1 hypothetical protein BAUCODRAFT_148564 [Baudoinia panamericana UAMH 10762]
MALIRATALPTPLPQSERGNDSIIGNLSDTTIQYLQAVKILSSFLGGLSQVSPWILTSSTNVAKTQAARTTTAGKPQTCTPSSFFSRVATPLQPPLIRPPAAHAYQIQALTSLFLTQVQNAFQQRILLCGLTCAITFNG